MVTFQGEEMVPHFQQEKLQSFKGYVVVGIRVAPSALVACCGDTEIVGTCGHNKALPTAKLHHLYPS